MQSIHISTDDFPTAQDARFNPQKWNVDWERIHSVFVLNQSRLKSIVAQASGARQFGRSVHRPQLRKSRTLPSSIYTDFEKGWLEAKVADRRKHIFTALTNAGSQAETLTQARAYCGDILLVDRLSKDGRTLLDLLRAAIPGDLDPNAPPATPYYFPEPTWDKVRTEYEQSSNFNQLEKYTFKEMLLLRTKLIWAMNSFKGDPLPNLLLAKERGAQTATEKREEQKKFLNEMKAKYGAKEGALRARERLAVMKEKKYACSHCKRPEAEGQKYQRCKPCWEKVQRIVLYCSVDCQKADWKPRHKAICGKFADSIDEAIRLSSLPGKALNETLPPSVSQVGPPVDGYKRSPLLVAHIIDLNHNPDADFIVHFGPGPDDFDEVYVFPPMQKVFLEAREKAMTTGDKETVVKLCHFVVWLCKADKHDEVDEWDLEEIIRHMEKEFEIPDLKKELRELQAQQDADRCRRPPLALSLSSVEWMTYIATYKTDLSTRLDL
ncbi:hypothetical protein D9758_012334 [Tetrapyrgos nigripes]|uniref:MYND-type domain-containing protein n=1 Tax=Tetrapyrgos nigripes TaxID=182062 RepID=A0A8H5FP02_9AGAR|nr:hypothetical protein D9758_012334 [Tetrapyrgos nigripes]